MSTPSHNNYPPRLPRLRYQLLPLLATVAIVLASFLAILGYHAFWQAITLYTP